MPSIPLPEGLPPRRAILAANMETALNAVWDGAPAAADRIAVVGGGVVGSLVAYLCARMPGTTVTLIDIDPARRSIATSLGCAFALPEDAPTGCDLVFHASAQQAGLNTAITLAGTEAAIIELSWYGTRITGLSLGGAFHSKRLRLIASQVGQVAPSHRPRWTHRRRLDAALRLLLDDRLDGMLAEDIAFEHLPQALPRILSPDSGVMAQVVSY